MTVDTERLRRLATAATPGPWGNFQAGWRFDENLRGGGPINGVLSMSAEWSICATFTGAAWGHAGDVNLDDRSERDAEFIAAANPATLLALLDRIDELTAKVEYLEIHAGFRAHPDSVVGFCPNANTDPMDL